MKILFIVGSLERGRNGVGDYSRRLAVDLIRQGHSCRLMALNDSFVENALGDEAKEYQENIQILRLPQSATWGKRVRLSKIWVNAFKPDLISLQFVPYSFHPKGLPFGLAKRLKDIAPGARWHTMFHELWIGMEIGCSLRHRIIGLCQRRLICDLLKTLQVSKISTQSSLYDQQLKRLGLRVNDLPLFGNIPVCDPVKSPNEVRKPGLDFLVFGNIYPGAPIREFARDCARYSVESKKEIRLTLLGRSGAQQSLWVDAWKAEGLEVRVLGEQSVMEISLLFQSASFGIATTPLALIEKSGAVAAMLEHSLPVIGVVAKWIPRGIEGWSIPTGVLEYRPSYLAELMTSAKNLKIRDNNVTEVSHQFIRSLDS